MSYLTDDERREHEKEERRRLSRQQIIEHVKKSLLFTAFDCKWIPNSANLVVLGQYPNNQGAISVYELHKGELKTLVDRRVPMPIKCGTFGHSAEATPTGFSSVRQLATGDFAGSIQLWDIELTTSDGYSKPTDRSLDKPVVEFKKAHDSIINCIDGALYSGPPELVTGSRDGSVRVWDPRQASKPVVSLNPSDPLKARDCWSVRFGNSHTTGDRTIAAGYDNGDIKLFDLRTNKMLHEFNVSNGVCDLEFDRADIEMNKLVVGSLEGRCRFYDLRTLHSSLGYAYVEDRVSNGTVWCAKSLPQNREIAVFGGAGELTLCKYNYPPDRVLKDIDGQPKGVAGTIEELNKVKVGDQPINSIDWNKSKEGLLACTSFDQSIRIMLVTKLSAVQ
eukprot:GILI01016329.1.p1 GENE.GILI01016329.1~~GILI01016329.1.p1  ORF type:complete len:404 (+),score=26.34 GILI01016329.1:40-1212(+)